MKHLKLAFWLAVLMSMAGTKALAYDALIDGIYYDFNTTDGTATVTYYQTGRTYRNRDYIYYNANAYTGDVIIPKTVTYNETTYQVVAIGGQAFEYCANLTSVTIPEGVTTIGGGAFLDCTGLTTVTIPEGVTAINGSAFNGCTGLTTVSIPKSVTEIGSSAFNYCSGLTKVIISDIAAWCNISFGADGYNSTSNPLYYAKHLYIDANTEITDIVVPEGVEALNYTFPNCESLKSVTIPASVTAINGAFYGCTNLTKVTLNSNAIAATDGHYSSPISPLFGTQVKEYVLGEGVTTIGEYAFRDCTNLEQITFPASLAQVGSMAFLRCTNLKKVIAKDIASWCGISFGTFYNNDANPLYYAKHLYSDEDTEITDLVVPAGIEAINPCAFYNCEGLKSVTIPNSLMSVGYYAFQYCI